MTGWRRGALLSGLLGAVWFSPAQASQQDTSDVFAPLRRGGAIVDVEAFRQSLPCARISLRNSGSPLLGGTNWSVELFRDGRAQLEAGAFSWRGQGSFDGWQPSFRGVSDVWDYGRLCEFLVTARLESLESRYRMSMSDLETVAIEVDLPDGRVAVEDYGGAGPAILWGAKSAIELVARRILWRRAVEAAGAGS